MKKIIWLSICLLIIGCNANVKQSNKIIVKDFPEKVNTKLQKCSVAPVLYCVGDMHIVDNILITVDMKNDVFFQFFQLPDFNYLGSQIKRGEGPEEEAMVLPFIYSIGKDTLAYRSLNQLKMAIFDKVQNKLSIIKKIDLPAQFMEILNCTADGNSIFGYNMMGKKSQKEYLKFDFTGNEVTEFGPSYPDVGMKINEDKQNMVFTKVMANSPSKDKFVALYDKFPLLRIYDRKNGSVIREIEYLNGQEKPVGYNNASVDPSELDRYAIDYLKIKTTDKYIYGLYSGKTNDELSIDKYNSGDFCSEIHIWDWEGNAISRLVLPVNVSVFAVSPDDSYILLYSYAYDNLLYKIDLIK